MKPTLIILLCATVLLGGCKCTGVYKTVESVGGCDKYYCSVKFTDGSIGRANPSIGEAIEGAIIYIHSCI